MVFSRCVFPRCSLCLGGSFLLRADCAERSPGGSNYSFPFTLSGTTQHVRKQRRGGRRPPEPATNGIANGKADGTAHEQAGHAALPAEPCTKRKGQGQAAGFGDGLTDLREAERILMVST